MPATGFNWLSAETYPVQGQVSATSRENCGALLAVAKQGQRPYNRTIGPTLYGEIDDSAIREDT